jgi:hypothetical protein
MVCRFSQDTSMLCQEDKRLLLSEYFLVYDLQKKYQYWQA